MMFHTDGARAGRRAMTGAGVCLALLAAGCERVSPADRSAPPAASPREPAGVARQAAARAGKARKKGGGKGSKAASGVALDRAHELAKTDASAADTAALLDTVEAFWGRYLRLDRAGLGPLLSADITRMSQRTRALQQGASAVLDGLAAEWEAFERPGGQIAETMTLRHLTLSVDDPRSATAAVLRYWVETEGGARWHYDDQGLVLQALVKENGAWKIAHQTEVWSTDYDVDDLRPGKETTFSFDYVYPAKDLARAVAFYTPILGKPDAVTATRAFFGLRGPRFIVSTGGLAGHASPKTSLPGGYGVLQVADLAAERQRLRAAGVKFLENTGEKTIEEGGDQLALIEDVAGNVVALAQRGGASGKGKPELTGLGGDPYLDAARKIAEAWLAQDGAALERLHAAGDWLDDTRLHNRGPEPGKSGLKQALEARYWPLYDRSSDGILARVEASAVKSRRVGKQTIVSYLRTVTGTGLHPFREQAFVTHVFDSPTAVASTTIASSTRSDALAIELDYTGHPAPKLKEAEKFYTNTLRLGSPYSDEDWRGYWGDNAVFGIYTASPSDDKLPIAGRANGYVSFWVRSAAATHEYLKKQGVAFPVIPAINSKRGVDPSPGYTQVVADDSEGNVVVFTEYTGKRK